MSPTADTIDAPAPVAEAPAAPDYGVAITIPHSALEGGEDRAVTFDLSQVPADARLDLLKAQARQFVTNRVNVANVRQNKVRAPFLAWAAYDAAIAADPLQTAVAKPEGERPTGTDPGPLDTLAKAQEAVDDLLKGEVRTQTPKGQGKSRAPRDPLVAAVTPIVVRALFDSRKAANTMVPVEGKAPRVYSYPDAVKEVGGDGIAYLNAQIDAKVNAAPAAEQAKLRADLEKQRDTRYLDPARVMIGSKQTKAQSELPSIL